MALLECIKGWWTRQNVPDPQRWVVVDVESSGLDTQHDRLLAIAAVGVHLNRGPHPTIVTGDSFEVVLRQGEAQARATTKSNILLHGIGVGAQRHGIEPAEALQAFVQWLGDAPLLAYHSAFDETMIKRDLLAVLGQTLPNAWTDLAEVAAALYPQAPKRSLDEWMAHFGIQCTHRHQAAADVWATAELLQHLWPQVCRQLPRRDYAALAELARQRRWLVANEARF